MTIQRQLGAAVALDQAVCIAQRGCRSFQLGERRLPLRLPLRLLLRLRAQRRLLLRLLLGRLLLLCLPLPRRRLLCLLAECRLPLPLGLRRLLRRLPGRLLPLPRRTQRQAQLFALGLRDSSGRGSANARAES